MKNLKDKLSSFLGWLTAVSLILGGSSYAAGWPTWVTTVFGIIALIGPVTNLFLTGKNADLSKKTDSQLEQQIQDKTKLPPIV